MILLLIHIADGSMERFSKHGFLPVNIDKKPFRISNFGISSIILFFLAFGIYMRGKNKSKLTTTLLIVGGALIGITALGVAVMDKTVATLLTVIVIGYVIMGLGILRAIQLRTKPLIIIATVAVVIVSAAMILGIQIQTSHNVLAQSAKSNATTTAANTVVTVTPRHSTNKTFWISTVHLDGATTIHAGAACDNCTQNIPPHPAEAFPNTTLPAGPGLVLRPPNKVGAWDMRAFTFAPDQIVVNQGDTVTLHFLGVQGPHHVITVEGVGTFPLDRGHIHTVSFIADKPGSITYWCSVHVPNMVGEILVLPKPA